MELKKSDFYFDLPQELIAQDPLEDRSSSRLLHLNKVTGEVDHHVFKEVPGFLKPGDCLVLNNTKVIPARLLGEREGTGAHVEVLLLSRKEKDVWETLVPLWLRSFIVPAANLGSNLGPWLVILGIVLMSAGRALGYSLAVAGVVLFGIATLFTLVTVPVEFDASSRAKKVLARLDIVAQGREYNTVSGVLFAAGLTYVAAAIGSIMQLLYWAYRAGLIGGRRD